VTEILSKERARRLWIHAQRLDQDEPFGRGPDAVRRAVEHLGYVQIDTIHVIERCHHHILYDRIPGYHREDLHRAQTRDKSVFEYWTHALSYIPTRDFRFYISDMKDFRKHPSSWYRSVAPAELRRVLRTIRKDGALSIRDIEDEVLVEKTHPWASRKPSKKALQLGFYGGQLTISERVGMLKKYELTERHFGWSRLPKAATRREKEDYLLDRALRSQAVVSLDSVCYLEPGLKRSILKRMEARVRKKELLPVQIEGVKGEHWALPETLDSAPPIGERVHVLSPFDPLVIQRKRLTAFFDYEHRFEAYLPKEKRQFGYFALPVLIGDRIVAAVDLKTDREKKKMLLQQWTWIGKHRSAALKKRIEEELHRFERFQLAPARVERV